jgi:hypothetical protein
VASAGRKKKKGGEGRGREEEGEEKGKNARFYMETFSKTLEDA